MSLSMLVFTIPFIFPVIFFVFFVLIVFVATQANRKNKEALRRLSSHLPGSMPKFSLMPCFCGEYQGLKFCITLLAGGENSPPRLKISLEKNSFFKLRIYEESFLSQLGERMGIIREVRTGDEIFDRQFLIFSNKPQQAFTYLGNSSLKDAIRRLFNRGFNSFIADGKRVAIYKPGYSQADLEPSKLVQAVQDLSLLARGL